MLSITNLQKIKAVHKVQVTEKSTNILGLSWKTTTKISIIRGMEYPFTWGFDVDIFHSIDCKQSTVLY